MPKVSLCGASVTAECTLTAIDPTKKMQQERVTAIFDLLPHTLIDYLPHQLNHYQDNPPTFVYNYQKNCSVIVHYLTVSQKPLKPPLVHPVSHGNCIGRWSASRRIAMTSLFGSVPLLFRLTVVSAIFFMNVNSFFAISKYLRAYRDMKIQNSISMKTRVLLSEQLPQCGICVSKDQDLAHLK